MTKRFEELVEELKTLEVGSEEAEVVLEEMQEVDEERFLKYLDESFNRDM